MSITKEENAFLTNLVTQACQQLNNFRRQEGEALEKEFTERINEIKGLSLRRSVAGTTVFVRAHNAAVAPSWGGWGK